MRAIDKFILHVVHNLFPLNEYSDKILNQIMQQYREEADDLNINISDDTLKRYIKRFDDIKQKIINKGGTDLIKIASGGKAEVIVPLSKLIKLVTSSAGAEVPEDDEDQTPDVVYHDGGKTIWNGSKEGNCITYGAGEKWCITRGSFSSYRYEASKGYPTFYLAKNSNLSDSDKLSFVAIQVRDVEDENRKYVYTNRENRPYESSPMSFSRLTSEIPWLNDIPNIRGILRYIPLNSKEQITQKYRANTISIREWINLPFNTKKQYLVIKKGGNFFNDITNDDFVSNYLPKYPQIAEFIAITPDITKPELLLKHLDKFSNQDRRSITANIQNKIDLKWLPSELFPFDVKKLLTVLNKWNLPTADRLYVTKDGNTIVKLKFGDTISVGLYTAEDDYPNIKLNQRTAKYLLDYPELDKLPFNSLLKLATDGVLDKEFINKVIEKAKSEENSAIIVKKVEDGEILVDSNSFTAYKIQNGKITKIPFADEEVQKVLGDEKDNSAFQQSAINVIKNSINDYENLPPDIDKDSFISIIKSTSYNDRTYTDGNGIQQVVLVPDGESDVSLFTRAAGNRDSGLYSFGTGTHFGHNGDWRERNGSSNMDEGSWRSYFTYLRNENIVYTGDRIQQWFRTSYGIDSKKAWFRAQPPFSPTDRYAPAIGANGVYYMVNKANPRESLKLSDSGKLIKANIPTAMARQLTGATPDEATPAARLGAGQAVAAPLGTRRGRPAGVPNAPRAAAPAAGGDINVSAVMDETGLLDAFVRLPRADQRRLNVTTGLRVAPNGDRGAARRNNQLGAAGRVGRVISIGPSKIYIIRLANASLIASINVQPGNRNYLLLPNGTMVTLNSPAELMQALQQRNLAEVRNYMVREYVTNNPQHLDEVRELIRQHVNETKNQ
jgi:hypothetical protein